MMTKQERDKECNKGILTKEDFHKWLKTFTKEGTKKSWFVRDENLCKKILLWTIEDILIWPFLRLYSIIKEK